MTVRLDSGQKLPTNVPTDLAWPLESRHLAAAAEEMCLEIQGLVPEYDRPPGSPYGRRMRWAVERTVRTFVDAVDRPGTSWDEVAEIFEGIGSYEARKGRSLDGLQTAIRVSGQVACRRFIKDARRLDWPLDTLGQVTESLFVFLEQIAGAAARGYAGGQEAMATERERARSRVRDLLVLDPPASREGIAELAAAARWEMPRRIAAVALHPPEGHRVPVLPPHILADWHEPGPYLLVPDPDGPGQDALIGKLVRDCQAAVGPTVPVTQGGKSLRWARHALDLVRRGVLAGPVHCLDHVATLVSTQSEELVGIALRNRLAPLLELPPHRREPLVHTLLAYMEHRDNAVAAAERLLVHEQTVRYRIRRLEEILGPLPYDPEHRLELMLLLHTWVRIGPPGDSDE